jgi:hypothetical protein
MGAKINYTDQHRQFLISYIPGHSYKDIIEAFNNKFNDMQLTESRVKNFTRTNKIYTGRTGYFVKGGVPVNKGTKGIMKANKTSFKKGNIPSNIKPIGHIRVDRDGFLYQKIQDGHGVKNYRMIHVMNWEKVNGPVPKGHKLIFADRNRSNVSVDNLILVSFAQALILNRQGLIYNDKDLTGAGVNIAKLQEKMYSKIKASRGTK